MKRVQMGEADKHAIRRKIEEKQVMVREQRKVRERLSRECADTMFHIASTESVIKSITAKHKELLENKAEDFTYSTAADRREVQQLEEKCAELERIVTSSDVVEREQKVLTARLAALRIDDEKEEVANAREMDALKRNLFNARNDLENVFRTTLHDLNVTYQDQAFDAMVQEATTAKEELPALRRNLRDKTRAVNQVIAKQSRSAAEAGCAKAERDLADEFVKLQAKREEKLRRSLESQREVIQRERKGIKDLGEGLETFREQAVELRAAAAELRHLRTESARVREECLQARAWAHTLAKKGPKALKAELRRRRLAALTAASAASFKSGNVDSGQLGAESQGCGDDEGGGDGNNFGDGDGPRDDGGKVERTRRGIPGSRGRLAAPCSGSPINGERSSATCYSDGNREDAATAAAATPTPERRDTCTLVAGMEVGGLGVGTDTTANTVDHEAEFCSLAGGRDKTGFTGTPHPVRSGSDVSSAATRATAGAIGPTAATAAGKSPSSASDRHLRYQGERHGPRRSPTETSAERIWRASLSGSDGICTNRDRRDGTATNGNSNTRGGDDIGRADAETEVTPSSDRAGPSSPTNDGSASLPAARAVHRQQQQYQASPLHEGSAACVTGLETDGEPKATSTSSTSPTRADNVPPLSTSLHKLPPEVLASVLLLSDHEFVGGRMSASDVLERARQWQQQQVHHAVPKPLQPLPDLPYSFTDLGRRVNVEK